MYNHVGHRISSASSVDHCKATREDMVRRFMLEADFHDLWDDAEVMPMLHYLYASVHLCLPLEWKEVIRQIMHKEIFV